MVLLHDESGAELDGCEKCGGVWLDWDDAHQLVPRPSEEPDVIEALELVETRGGPAIRRCPRCSKKLMALKSSVIPALKLDGCDEHGVFFDDGELEVVAPHAPRMQREARSSGPLQMSPRDNRTPEIDKQLREMNEEHERRRRGWFDTHRHHHHHHTDGDALYHLLRDIL